MKRLFAIALLVAAVFLSGCASPDGTDWWDEHRQAVKQSLDACMAEGGMVGAGSQRSICDARCNFWDECAKPQYEQFFLGGCRAEECGGLPGSECEQKCTGYVADQMEDEYKCPWWFNEHGGAGYIAGGECTNIGYG